MSTGDIRGNIAQLERSLKHLKYPAAVDIVGLSLGDPLAALPILNFILLKYSRHVAAYVIGKGVQLQGKADEAFVKAAFRLFRDMGLKPVISPTQFLEQGFAERKVLLLCAVVSAARNIHTAAAKQERAKTLATYRPSPAKLSAAAASPPQGFSVDRNGVAAAGGSMLRVQGGCDATDASQTMYETVSSPTTWTAEDLVNKLIVSPAAKPKPSPSKSTLRAPTAAVMLVAANVHELPTRPLLKQQQHASRGSSSPHDQEPCVDQLIAAGLLPLPQQQLLARPQEHQQDITVERHRPLRAALWPPPFTQKQQQQHVQLLQQEQQSLVPPEDQQQQQQQLLQQQHAEEDPPWAGPAALRAAQAQQQQQQQPPRQTAAAADKAAAAVATRGSDLVADESGEMIGAISSWQPTVQGRLGKQQQQQQQGQQAEPVDDAAVCQQRQEEGIAASAAEVTSLVTVSDVLQLQQQLAIAQVAVQQLGVRLEETQQQLAQQRLAAAKYEESASARITLLAGQVRFLENKLNSQHQHQQQQQQQQQQQRFQPPVSAAAAAAVRPSSHPPAQRFISRVGQPAVSQATSPATIHTTSAPIRHTPLKENNTAAAPLGGDGSSSSSSHRAVEDIDWRSAAMAATAAVVAGLSASPVASPVRRIRPFGATTDDARVAQQQQQQHEGGNSIADVVGGVRDSAAAAATSAAPNYAGEAAPAAAAEISSCNAASGDNPPAAAAAAASDNRPAAAAAPAVGRSDRPAGTGQLINQLASRAVEAQQLLQALMGSR